ncbi:ribosome maturation factor RimP [Eupransor demetentiae]|uniref:Ribosome maturation factor RimP n=1 Tax=Eupransor demetentiae TaxID=3109584 RepID=A0ABM9N4E9_9LACO|nr:Ribosome maturation factor RimP (RimP) [Lactobacillaceae bacterium LMG 33000]
MPAKDRLLALIEPLVKQENLLLWDLSVQSGGGRKVVQILIDLPDHETITMDKITDFTQLVNEALDEADPDPMPGAYMLDIASPGADRPLKEPWHYAWSKEADEPIKLALFAARDGQKQFEGKILNQDDQGLDLETGKGQEHFSYDEIAKAILNTQF